LDLLSFDAKDPADKQEEDWADFDGSQAPSKAARGLPGGQPAIESSFIDFKVVSKDRPAPAQVPQPEKQAKGAAPLFDDPFADLVGNGARSSSPPSLQNKSSASGLQNSSGVGAGGMPTPSPGMQMPVMSHFGMMSGQVPGVSSGMGGGQAGSGMPGVGGGVGPAAGRGLAQLTPAQQQAYMAQYQQMLYQQMMYQQMMYQQQLQSMGVAPPGGAGGPMGGMGGGSFMPQSTPPGNQGGASHSDANKRGNSSSGGGGGSSGASASAAPSPFDGLI